MGRPVRRSGRVSVISAPRHPTGHVTPRPDRSPCRPLHLGAVFRPALPPLSARSVTSSLRRFEPFFGAGVRSRGATYARGDRVSIADANDTWLSAYVRGSRRYTVELELEGKHLVGKCTCPYADSLDPCKHIWATLMVADFEGALPWLSEARTFTMTGGYELDEGAGEVLDDDDEQDDEDEGDDASSPLAPPVRLVVPPPRARHQPSWRALFERDAAAGPIARIVPVLRYVVNIERTRSSGHLQLDLYRPDRREGQWRTASVQRPFEIYAAGDAPLLAMLEVCSSGSYHYGPASSFELSNAGVAPVIERLCTAGLLRVGDVAAPVAIWDPRPYVAAIVVEAPEVPGRGYRLVPVLEREGQRVDADEPRLVLGDKLVLWTDRVAPLSGGSACRWLVEHRLGHRMTVPAAEIDELVELACSRIRRSAAAAAARARAARGGGPAYALRAVRHAAGVAFEDRVELRAVGRRGGGGLRLSRTARAARPPWPRDARSRAAGRRRARRREGGGGDREARQRGREGQSRLRVRVRAPRRATWLSCRGGPPRGGGERARGRRLACRGRREAAPHREGARRRRPIRDRLAGRPGHGELRRRRRAPARAAGCGSEQAQHRDPRRWIRRLPAAGVDGASPPLVVAGASAAGR